MLRNKALQSTTGASGMKPLASTTGMPSSPSPMARAAPAAIFIDQYGIETVDRNRLVERAHGRTVGQIASVPAIGGSDHA